MSISSLQLDAFFEVAKARSFSEAARRLHITQPALSSRVLNLEEELGSTLFIREPSGLRLTELGETLLRYCQTRESLEGEILGALDSKDSKNASELRGVLRIAGYSTVMRSIVVPSIGDLVRENPQLQLNVLVRELRELPTLLKSGEAEWVFTAEPIRQAGIVCEHLADEEYVLVTRKQGPQRDDTYLDHDPDDMCTIDFFKLQAPDKTPKRITRSYCDDIYGLIDGVLQGFGKAVIPAHLAKHNPDLKVIRGYKPLILPVYLNYYSQPFYTRLQQQVLEALRTHVPKNAR